MEKELTQLNTQIYDRIISLKLYYRNEDRVQAERVYEITCPKSGMKPRIDLSWSRVQGTFCYHAQISIYNLWVRTNSIWVKEIEVVAGYTDNETQTFSFTPFASYTPDPGPDGFTVFECVTGTAKGDIWQQKPYDLTISVSPQPPTIQQVLEFVQAKLGINLYLNNSISQNMLKDELAKLPFTTKDIPETRYSTGYALLVALKEYIQEAVSPLDYTVAVIVFNNYVEFVCLKKGCVEIWSQKSLKDTLTNKRDYVPYLERISGANWNAGVLTVTAPWVPRVQPGTLFKIRPKYYQGGYGLPNSQARTNAQKDEFDIYFVLQQKVSFSTTENINSMTIMAVPMRTSPAANQIDKAETESPEVSMDDVEKAIQDTYTVTSILVNGVNEIASDAKHAQQSASTGALEDLVSYQDYTIKSGDTLTDIMEKFNLPAIAYAQDAGSACEFIPGSWAWYPFCVQKTYSKYCENKDRYKLYKIDPSSPDDIRKGNRLCIPSPTVNWATIHHSYTGQWDDQLDEYAAYYVAKGQTAWAETLLKLKQVLNDKSLVVTNATRN